MPRGSTTAGEWLWRGPAYKTEGDHFRAKKNGALQRRRTTREDFLRDPGIAVNARLALRRRC
jgi:hypothetical protein